MKFAGKNWGRDDAITPCCKNQEKIKWVNRREDKNPSWLLDADLKNPSRRLLDEIMIDDDKNGDHKR